ncbi:nuclear transport factor 2 family protein [Dyadobacter sp. CY345]|uniref:nuclear transport factor 2 family protein n=1 Tax=Dyadobacter sp. CY345 TaxID=2909335 RepID=UPI001F2815D5|nr:nuclear transport factor 2 family protein [Dyadobacter sp. CY345]MCF2443363.1 nuclear transport factor 2 family protein [Dyadobacter sp. CY345]
MEAKETVASYFDALANGEVEKALSFFTPETKWSQPGNNKFSGVKNNLDEIFKMFEGIMGDTAGNMTVRPHGAMTESGSFVAAPVWFTAKKESKTFDLGGMDLFEVKSGKIMHVWTFSDDQQVDDEFWGK